MPTGPRPFAPNCAHTALVHLQNGVECVCTVDWRGTPSWTYEALQALVASLATNWGLEVMPLLAFNTALTRVEGRGLRSASDDAYELSLAPAIAGGLLEQAMDNQQATCISKRTTISGKGGRGRIYVPGLTNGVLTDGRIDAQYRGELATAVKTAIDNTADENSTFTPVVISYELSHEWRPSPLITNIGTWQSRTSVPASMNSRRPD